MSNFNAKVIVTNEKAQDLETFFKTEVNLRLEFIMVENYNVSPTIKVLLSKTSGAKVKLFEKGIVLKTITVSKCDQDLIEKMWKDADFELTKAMEVDLRFVRIVELQVNIVEPLYSPVNVEKPYPFTIYAAYSHQFLVFYVHCRFDDCLSVFLNVDKDGNTIKKSFDLLFNTIRDYDEKFRKTENGQNVFPVFFQEKHDSMVWKTVIKSLGLEDLSAYGKSSEYLPQSFMNVEKKIPSKEADSKILVKFMNSFNHLPYTEKQLKDFAKDLKYRNTFDKEFREEGHFGVFLENDFFAHTVPEICLQNCPISEKEYKIWQLYDLKSVKDFYTLSMKFRVFFLVDLFQNYREECLNTFKVDPCYFEDMSSFSWSAMKKMTNVELEEITDPEMENLISRNIEDVPRFKTFRIPNMDDFVMCENLPLKDFKWIDPIEDGFVEKILREANDENQTGYFLEVDLDHPFFIKCSKKLIHYKHLASGLKKGGNLTKVHRIISFTQSPWLKHFIQHNMENGKTTFEKSIFKIMNEKVFEKVQKNASIELIEGWKEDDDPNHSSIEELEDDWAMKPSYFDFSLPELMKNALCEPSRIPQKDSTFLVFNGKIEYYEKFEDISSVCSNLINWVEKQTAKIVPIAFDRESPIVKFIGENQDKTAVIQICADLNLCYLFYVYQLEELPDSLIELLHHSKVVLNGFCLSIDFNKLERDFRGQIDDSILKEQCMDLRFWYKRIMGIKTGKYSDERLVYEICNVRMKRQKFERWFYPYKLKEDHRLYAATRVYASQLVYCELEKLEKRKLERPKLIQRYSATCDINS